MKIKDDFKYWWKQRNDGSFTTRWMCRCLIAQRRKGINNPWID